MLSSPGIEMLMVAVYSTESGTRNSNTGNINILETITLNMKVKIPALK